MTLKLKLRRIWESDLLYHNLGLSHVVKKNLDFGIIAYTLSHKYSGDVLMRNYLR